ncbi:MAG: DUF3015 family protein [Bdellovibrionales bacterium]
MKKVLLTSIAFLAFGFTAQAEPINPWLHCGIGAMIFTKPEHEVAAAISNIIWDLGTTAVSSKVSSVDSCAGNPNVAAAKIITESYANLEAETVQGSGEYTTAMLDTMKCDRADQPAIMKDVRARFGKQIKNADYATMNRMEKAQSYYGMVKSTISENFSGSCGA